MTLNHGGGEGRCELCTVREQLFFAREAAKAIPTLEAKFAALGGEE